ncbi:NAD(P)/FAD-dependent oxidoreductase [Streptomyces sp. TRM66268-LWL]|uniref:NAD(P)/FAD-dependent oxidoreductase n=1 Tax=Streptomyces polyasparticus TaxID=2767826 RepID=A0ABR7SPR4_9ACTN|nr:NAD(P)/FAD-dependent oxidoreductase [Streptomyces polyasparticus]MBC9717349.1 NAD(P)/FAD-dependent oxidoreductase [Streptomyces polyasparticus]
MTRSTEAQRQSYDVVVVGGGTAGLSAALGLGRSLRSVLVIDAGEPRNAPAAHMHGYLSRDGMPPAEFLEIGRSEVESYGGEIVSARVEKVAPDTGGEVDVTLADGTVVHARRVVIATGLVDELPDIPGLAARWGHDVLHCPYCHGYEVRGRAFGVIARPEMGAHQALLVTQWSKDVTLFLHQVTELPDEQWQQLKAAGVRVVSGEVAEVVVENDRLTGVRLASGEFFARDVLFTATRPVPRTDMLPDLTGDALNQTPFGPFPAVDEVGRSGIPGVWIVGNAMGPAEMVVNSASAGYRAATLINAELVFDDLADRGA